LARRFQVVKVEEPTETQCMVMMRGIVGALENHHNVRILDEAVNSAVRLSHRYLAGRQLPDKAVSVLDTACARLSLGQSATHGAQSSTRMMSPEDIDSLRSELASLTAEMEQIQGETPLMRVCVDQHIIGEVISGWTGIPIGKMVKDEIATVLELEKVLQRRVI